jgi:kynureninase
MVEKGCSRDEALKVHPHTGFSVRNIAVKELKFELGSGYAIEMDRNDPLRYCREKFVYKDQELIYLDGNSLGRLAYSTSDRIREVVEEEWGKRLIRSWNEGWFYSTRRIGDKIASLVGAEPGEVIVSDSTSINLFKLLLAGLEIQPDRAKIVSDEFNFPSDLYVLQGCISLMGNRHILDLVKSRDGISIDDDAFFNSIDRQTAIVTLSHVAFKSGFLYNAQGITEHAHQQGALVIWDLCHSVGVVPIKLDRWNVDMAVGCTYKYLNGGPGSPAFLYIRRDLQNCLLSPITGWFSQESPFSFDLNYRPTEGITRFLVSSPPMISMLAIEPAIDIISEAGVERIRQKSVKLTSYLVYLVDTILVPLGFTLGSPRDASKRGSHISLRHPEGYRINRALIEEMSVLPDFREPDNIRLGLAPLYTSFIEVWEAVDRIRRVIVENRYLKYPTDRLTVT